MKFDIRPFHITDLTALYRICLLTGDNGSDATSLYSDPDLVGHYFAAPYAVLEPELCFVLTGDGMPIGYILGCADSAEFHKKCEKHWFPPLRQRYPKPTDADSWTASDKWIINQIHEGIPAEDDVTAYPAHLHIDLLPIGQKGGWGRKMMALFWDKLRSLGVPAVHLGVSRANTNAVGFYQHIGYHTVVETSGAFILGKHL